MSTPRPGLAVGGPALSAVIFDLDGVLIDSAEPHRKSWQALGRELGIDISQAQVSATFGRQNRDIVPLLYGADRTEQDVRRLGDRKEELYRELVRGRVPANAGAVELVRHCHEHGYRLAIGSSTPRANVELALAELGLDGLFEVIVAGEDVATGKPDPAVFLTAAERLGIPPGECLVIEDAPAGVAAAVAAGIPVAALAGSHPIATLSRADRIIHHLTDLIPHDDSSAT